MTKTVLFKSRKSTKDFKDSSFATKIIKNFKNIIVDQPSQN